jgi:A/G-specific adenine glycosylase
MLQQTTVATVLRYYERFLDRFPTVVDLANASEQDVLHLWQGLGYYRRARNMHRAAQVIRDKYAGEFPRTLTEIEKLPGLGRYTARAIASFALHQPVPIVEANTRRLWCRVSAAVGDPTKAPLEEALWHLAEVVLPARSSWDFNQAAMDVGSTLCTPKEPACDSCPLASHCVAHELGQEESFPQLPPKRTKVDVQHASVVLWNGKNEVLVRQRPDDGTWAGLWEFVHVELGVGESPKTGLKRTLGPEPFRSLRWTGRTHQVRHTIMHYRVQLVCLEARIGSPAPTFPGPSRWISPSRLSTLPFSTPQRKLVAWLTTAGLPPS